MIAPGDRPLIQIAGVCDAAEARLLMDAGVRWLGFPLRLTVNKEDLSEDEAAAIIRGLPAGFHGVLITYLDRADDVLAFCAKLGSRAVQLHGDIATEELCEIRRRDPDLTVFKSLVIRDGNEETLRRMVEETSPFVDAYITDTFNPATGQEGATGLVHDWGISRRLVEFSPKPVILAGGLNPENVAEAIRAVRPAGVDSHTGVEGPDGRKSAGKVRLFVAEAQRAFSQIC
ncbi:MAG TPA: N-(5'-phosphoribosyl)anthranilate isomerase [Verrucomicrobia bacterium]|nr:N-(5'-phosphoribosyl)anthranilate isomerase [Verrucomicrobiota bacterium]